jgi:predicted lipid-binding transport protein (Tim44 family)
MVAIIVILVLLLAVLFIGFLAVSAIREKVRSFSRLAWGTDSVTEGIEKMQEEYASTPKSVSAMTSLYLPKITADFPEFKYDEMKGRAENVLVSYLMGKDKEDASLLKDGNQELKDKLQSEIEMNRAAGIREHFESVEIHRTEIAAYQKKQGRCIITFQASVQYYGYSSDRDGKVTKGNKSRLTQSKYNIHLIYIQDRNLVEEERDFGLGLNCPNCGAPISGLGAKVCEYCGTPVLELNIKVWTFSDVREVQ